MITLRYVAYYLLMIAAKTLCGLGKGLECICGYLRTASYRLRVRAEQTPITPKLNGHRWYDQQYFRNGRTYNNSSE